MLKEKGEVGKRLREDNSHLSTQSLFLMSRCVVRYGYACSGTNIQREQLEMRLIFQLGTVQPKGLNIKF